ncbi:tetratricopeptide repeat-containing sulfotransferase family protein [Alteromonas oceanisediminis]|uniref:tetratricopeptide repeat-containing sulfotransferase family protein n=1 Tax=Alteromonas oceanisediminis TaxID=2836180 RepID=UPI001BD92709|nr:sulfotransferase [Alteromonas oceanisediminis]MBT0584830.1 tetratricopeptide repeat protein [Alteromonas oceanisediminis]
MSSSAQLIAQAEACLRRREVANAEALLMQCVAQENGNAIALMHLCLIQFSKRHYETAESYLNAFLNTRSAFTASQAAEHFIRTLLQFNRFNDALKVAEKVSHWFPSDLTLRWLHVQAALQSRAIDKALSLTSQWVAAVDETHKAQVMLTHANTLAKKGHFSDAVVHYEAVLAEQPNNSYAIAGLLKSQRVKQTNSRYQKFFDHAYANAANDDHRARVKFAQAKYFNDIGEYQQAWQCAEQANQMKQSQVQFSRDTLSKQVDATLQTFSAVNQRGAAQQTDGEPDHTPHILVVGMPRSGTTLVEQMLATLPDYYAGGETPALEVSIATGRHGQYYLAPLAQGKSIDETTIAQSYTRYFRQFSNFAGHIIVNKVPTNFFHVGLFKHLFPQGKIINLQRDPFDVAASIFFESFSAQFAYTHSLDNILFVYDQYQRLMAEWSQWYGSDILNLDYEHLVSNYSVAISQVEQFLEVKMPGEAEIRGADNPVETPSIWQVRQPINRHAVGRWTRYAEAFEPFRERYNK